MFDKGASPVPGSRESRAAIRSRADRVSPGIKRRKWGIYYTPQELARLVARWCVRSPDEVLLEPSFGGCALLAAAVEVFGELGCSDASDHMFGFDIDRAAFKSLDTLGLSNRAQGFRRLDFLASRPAPIATTVFANPPYVQYHKIPKARRELLREMREQFPEARLSGRASLWAYFVLHATRFLCTGGRIAFILPRALETSDYSESLLAFVRSKFKRTSVVHIDERLFRSEGADEQVSVLLAEGYQETDGERAFSEIRVATLDDFARALRQTRGNADASPPYISPRGQSLQLLSELPTVQPLCKVATVQIGEVVGATKFFVRSLKEWRSLGIAKRHLKPLLTRAGQCTGLSLDDATIVAGDVPYLLLPPKKSDEQVERLLATFAVEDRERNSTFRKRETWYRCSYDTDFDAAIPSLVHLFARVLSNDAGISCGNGFYKLRTEVRSLAAWLPVVALSTPFRLSVELYGRPRGGGALKLEPSDVRRLLVPVQLPTPGPVLLSALRECESFVRRSDVATATDIADEVLYLQAGSIDLERLNGLRSFLRQLLRQRLPQLRSI